MANNYTRWYREGTISATQNSNVITGQNTLWQSIGLKPGDMFSIDNITEYEIDTITDNTHLTLKTNYAGASVSNVKYRIIRNWTANSNADVAAMASELLGDVARYLDKDLQTLTGKSAYKAACDNGFVGTESEWLASLDAYGVAVKNGYTGTRAQWLESLKAAGEWTQANSRITTLETDNTSNKSKISAIEGVNAGTRLTELEKIKSIEPIFTTDFQEAATVSGVWGDYGNIWDIRTKLRGKYLGTTITADQYQAITKIADYKNGSLNPYKVQIGDFWRLTIDGQTYTA
ncbi:MAG: hypothetical protein IJT21_08490, partial [Synergistaceae bacterium]|nr:hypothetical protein [Synergistaceae bacterium]